MYDPSLAVRESAAQALQAALNLVVKRQNPEKWFTKLWDRCYKSQPRTVEQLHGSLLVIGELLRIPSSFRERHFKESCDKILKLKVAILLYSTFSITQ